MKTLKIGAAALNQTPLDWTGNRKNIENAIKNAKEKKIELLCLPELSLSGYGCEDAFYAHYVSEKAWESLMLLLPQTQNIILAVGLPLNHQNRLYNVMALVVNGAISGFVAKRFLANDGVHYESRWFNAWQSTDSIEKINYEGLDGKSYPLGNIIFEIDGIKIGFEICEDAWVAQRPASYFYSAGIDLILNPSASHFSFKKASIRQQYILDSSRRFECTYLYTNLLGNEAGPMLYDGSAAIAQGGKWLMLSKPFSFENFQISSALIDLEKTRLQQRMTHKPYCDAIALEKVLFKFNYSDQIPNQTFSIPLPMSKEESLLRALALGLFDYMRKSHTHGFTISLSGGMDSSAVLCACYFMIILALDDLGLEKFKKKLSYFKAIQKLDNVEALTQKIITTVYQASKQSSSTTLYAAENLANALAANFYNVNIESLYQDYVKNAEQLLGYQLNWKNNDLALQNIQARVRSPQVWLLANLKNSLLLATSNRSEIAVGYCTMDGDTSGGLAPLGGIDKDFLKKWLNWLEKENLSPKHRLPILKLITQQTPTAELRPLNQKQTDEKDLMPYELLNKIETLAILEKKSPADCFACLEKEYEPNYLKSSIKKFFRLWRTNQWKRERYALSFHVDDRNLDPKSWCRFPVLSGNEDFEDLKTL